MPRRKKKKEQPNSAAEGRKTRIPITRIRKLIKLDDNLKKEVKAILEEYDVTLGYLKGILRQPMK